MSDHKDKKETKDYTTYFHQYHHDRLAFLSLKERFMKCKGCDDLKKFTENESELIEQIKNNQKDQLAAGHHGVPLSVYKNSYFFGQDRFDDLINELKKDGLNYP